MGTSLKSMGHGLVLHSHFCHALDAQAPMVLKMIERRVGLRMCHSLAICQHLRVRTYAIHR